MSPGPIQLDQATALTLMLGPNGSVGIQASKDYLQILQYAARLSESAVNTVLGQLLRSGELPTLGAVEVLLQLSETPPLEDVHIDEVELTAYDHLLDGEQEVVQC